jgi:phage-related minor tail protein
MKLSALTQEAIYKQTLIGVEEAPAKFDKMAKSAEGAGDAQEVLAKQTDAAEKSITRLGSKMAAYTNSQLDPVAKQLAKVEYGERLIAAARKEGKAVTDEMIAAVDAAREKYQKLTGGLNDNASAQARLSDAMQKAAAMTATMSRTGGMSDPTAMTKRMSQSANDAAKAAGLARHEWVNLSRQGQDVAVSLYGGQSPLTVLAQQGGQIADVFASSKGGASAALKEFGGVVTSFVLNPVTLLVGGVAGLTAAMVQFESQQTRLQRATNGAGALSGLTAEGLRQAGLAGAAQGGFAPSQGVNAAAALAGTGKISGELIPGLVASSQRYADAFGLSQPEALQELAKAFADPVKGAEQLDERLGFLDGKTKEYIRTLREQGDALGAQRALFDAFNASLQKTADTTWTVTKAWRLFRAGLESPIETAAAAIDSALAPAQTAAEMARTRAAASRAAADRMAQTQSVEISDRVTKFLPEISQKQSLQDAAAFFRDAEKNTAAMGRLGVSVEDFYKAQEQASNRLAAYRSESEKVTAETYFRTKAMGTLNEGVKSEIEAQKTYADTVAATGDKELAATKATGVRAEAAVRLTMAMRELNKEAANQLELAGKSSVEQQFIRLEQESRDQMARGEFSSQAYNDKAAAIVKQYQADTFTNPIKDIAGQSRMLDVQNASLGKSTYDQAFDAGYMEKFNQFEKDNIEITPSAVDLMNQYAKAHADFAVAVEHSSQLQSEFTGSLDIMRSTAHDVGASLVDAFRRGENAITAMQGVLDRLISKLVDKTLDNAISGLMGAAGSASTGAAGGLLGSVVGGVKKLFSFANGGVMTSAGPLPLTAYANGGIADRPQLAMFGEGRKPEAFVPLPDGRRIPVAMQGGAKAGAKITIQNFAGAQVEARELSTGEILVVVDKMVDQKLRSQVPGIMANSQRRAM